MTTASRSPGSKASNARRATPGQRRQQHMLKGVTVRTTQAARQRRQWFFGLSAKMLLAVCLGTGMYFGAKKSAAWLVLKNPDYNVAELNVETDGVLTPESVLEAADLHKGSNIFMVNLSRAQARVEAIPQVEKVQVTRQLPNKISIQINERKPVAWVAPEQGAATRDEVTKSPSAYLIDARGVLWPPKKRAPQDFFLPIIRHYSNGPRSDGQEVEGEEIKAALDLLRAHQDSMIGARFQIQEIDLAKHFGLQVTDRNGLQVLFGLDDMDRQLKRLDVYLQVIDQRGEKAQTINLLAQKNVPITFVTAPTLSDKPADPPPAAAPVAAVSSTKPAPVAAKDKSKTRSKEKTASPKHAKTGGKIQPFESTHKGASNDDR